MVDLNEIFKEFKVEFKEISWQNFIDFCEIVAESGTAEGNVRPWAKYNFFTDSHFSCGMFHSKGKISGFYIDHCQSVTLRIHPSDLLLKFNFNSTQFVPTRSKFGEID